MSVECKFTFSQDSRCRVTGERSDVVSILTSANAKYHYIFPFFYKMDKEIHRIRGSYMGHTIKAKTTTKSMNSHQKS